MELLGSYSSQLTDEYYQQLLALLDAAISAGDLSGGSAFNQANLLSLEQQAQNFNSLPTGTAGSRVTDDSFNYPLSLLLARLNALQAEVDNFTTVSGRLLDILVNETSLVDDLLAADSFAQWQASLPELFGSWSTGWDFSTGQGAKSPTLPSLDPSTGVTYSGETPTTSIFNCTTGQLTTGLRPPVAPRTFPFSNLLWTYPSRGTPQELYAPDMSWTQLDLLLDEPDIDFSAPPQAQILLPQGGIAPSMFQFVGQVPGGAMPTYVRVLFYPRLNSLMNVSAFDGVAVSLSAYQIDPNSVVVLAADGSDAYTLTTDYNTDPSLGMTPVDIGISTTSSTAVVVGGGSKTFQVGTGFEISSGQAVQIASSGTPANQMSGTVTSYSSTTGALVVNVTSYGGSGTSSDWVVNIAAQVDIYFTEYWPAYQCSMDEVNWSPIFMLDVNRPYPDDATSFPPLDIENGLFPLMDETGVPTGIYFQPLQILTVPYTLLVTTPPGSSFGPQALLEMDVAQPSYLNTVSLSPYAAFPCVLQKVEVEGLTATTRQTVWAGSYLMEEPIEITFPRQIVAKVYLTLTQQNYTIKEYQLETADALRQQVMSSIQSSLPINMQGAVTPAPETYRGYQYEYGFEDLTALDSDPTPPGVFVQGPIIIPRCPDVIRFDAVTSGTVSCYLCYRAFDASGNLLDENTNGFAITSGTAKVFPFSSGVTRANVVSTEVDLRFVLRSTDAAVARYFLQATLH